MNRATDRGQSRQKLRVGIVLLDKFTLNSLSGFVEALRLAADIGGRSRQIECGWAITGHGTVRASCGLNVVLESTPINPGEFDYVAVCGGNDYAHTHQPAWVDAYLQDADAKGVPVIGLCTGTFNVARAGLLKGRLACVHWNVREAFCREFPDVDIVSDRIFLDDGDRITCAGSTGASDLALHLISRHCGTKRAQQSQRHMILSQQRVASFPQAQFVTNIRDVTDTRVRQCIHFMEQALNEPVSVTSLATWVGLSERQLNRRFQDSVGMTAARYFRELRLRYGAWRLAHTTDRVAAIAADAGFADSAHFSREFRRLFACTPVAYRRLPGYSSTNLQTEPAPPVS